MRPNVLSGVMGIAVLAAVSLGAGAAGARPDEALVAPARLEKISRAYLGTPYSLDALGEASGPDRDPLFTRKCVDCQTLVEQVLSEAIAPAVGGQDRAVRLVRYHGGQVSLENRYHYCIPDWLNNPWPAQDITSQVGGRSVVPLKRSIDLPGFLAGRGGNPARSPVKGARSVSAVCIPRSRAGAVPAKAVDGTIAVWVLNKPGIVAGHVGFLFNRGGKVVFRHASQRRKQVIDQPVTEYLARAPRNVMGLIVLRPTLARIGR